MTRCAVATASFHRDRRDIRKAAGNGSFNSIGSSVTIGMGGCNPAMRSSIQNARIQHENKIDLKALPIHLAKIGD
jgi:hypothetical protein